MAGNQFIEICVFQIHYNRPRMYLFTYAVDDDNTNEMYAEFHLGIEYIIL